MRRALQSPYNHNHLVEETRFIENSNEMNPFFGEKGPFEKGHTHHVRKIYFALYEIQTNFNDNRHRKISYLKGYIHSL